MSYLDICTTIHVDAFMDNLSSSELDGIAEWMRNNKPMLLSGNETAGEILFHQQIDHIKDNYSRLTIEQEEQIKQIYESL